MDVTRGPEIGPNFPKVPGQPERNIAQENAAAYVASQSVESVSHNLISQATEPKHLFDGLREKEAKWERGDTAQPLGNDFSPPPIYTTIVSRAHWLGQSPDELIRKGYLIAYDEQSGMGVLRSPKKHGGLVIDNERIAQDTTPENWPITWVDLGLRGQRAGLAKAYEIAGLEINVRALMGEQYGILTNLNVRDDLATIVDWEHGTQATYRPEHMRALFNLPSMRELEGLHPYNYSVENIERMKELGDQIEEGMICELIMMKSASKDAMLDLLSRPGALHLITKMAKEVDARRLSAYSTLTEEQKAEIGEYKPYTFNDWVTEYIGDVRNWVEDKDRNIKKTWREETKDRTGIYAKRKFGKRGRLTRWGSIISFTGNPGEISSRVEKDFIEKDVADAVGSVEAAWMATVLMRDIGAFSSKGYVALSNGQGHAELGAFRVLSADDRMKFLSYLFFAHKEGFSGRSSGLQELIYRVPDMEMDLFDWGQVTMEDMYERDETGAVKINEFGEAIFARRSIWDAWLGTAEQPKIDLVTGKIAEYGIRAVEVDKEKNGTFTVESDKELIDKGLLVLFEGPHPKHGKNSKFYVTREDSDKIRYGQEIGARYDEFFKDENDALKRGKEKIKIKTKDPKSGEEIEVELSAKDVARLVTIKDPEQDPEKNRTRQLYMTAEDELKIGHGGAILMEEKDYKPDQTNKGKGDKVNESRRVFYAKKVQAEPYHRLGDLKWDSLETYWHGTFGTMQWLMGREKGGVWSDYIKNVDEFGPGNFSLHSLKNMIKYIGITGNLITLTHGSPHLYDTGRTTLDAVKTFDIDTENEGSTSFSFHVIQTEGTETIQRNLLRNIIAARIHTSNWVLNIMNAKANAYNLAFIGGPLIDDIPLSNILELFIKEALKGTPKTEDELLAHYVDDLSRLQNQIDINQPKKFYDETGRWLRNSRSKEVGVRRGRKASHVYTRLN